MKQYNDGWLFIKLHLEADILASGIIQPDDRVIELRLFRGIKPLHPTPSLVKQFQTGLLLHQRGRGTP